MGLLITREESETTLYTSEVDTSISLWSLVLLHNLTIHPCTCKFYVCLWWILDTIGLMFNYLDASDFYRILDNLGNSVCVFEISSLILVAVTGRRLRHWMEI